MQRLHAELAKPFGLRTTYDEGDLLLRLRRSDTGWDALLRISPRPLATRAWRVRNFAGAPNASLAYAMARLTIPHPDDRVLNLCCGSGTLLVERCLLGPTQWVLGIDNSQDALACARANLSAAGIAKYARLELDDVTHLPLDDASVDVILADLPFGQLSGSHRENERLYPLILAEAGRVAMPGTRMVLLTHEIRLLEQAATQHAEIWQLYDIIRVRTSGMTPGIFLLERRGNDS
jgi:23S rRNA G2445 N2-methylase RlmL